MTDKIDESDNVNELSVTTQCVSSIFLQPVTQMEIIKPNKSPGPNGTTVKIMQNILQT